MNTVYLAWAVSAGVLILAAIWVGLDAPGVRFLGIFVDSRGRFSLTKLQLTLWTIVVVSLVSGLFLARWIKGVDDALGFSIPDQLLIVLGISVGSAATSTTIKASKDRKEPDAIAASNEDDRPRFAQMFLEEEGEYADRVVDIPKFQNFWFTILAVAAYVLLAIREIEDASSVATITLPGFSATILTLLGISHAGYLAGKLPTAPAEAPGLTLEKRRNGATPVTAPAAPGVTAQPNTYVPRNPR